MKPGVLGKKMIAPLERADPEQWQQLPDTMPSWVKPITGSNTIKEAMDPLQQAVNLNSMDYVAAYRLGEVQARLGNYESAVGYLEQSISSAPSRTVEILQHGSGLRLSEAS